MKEKIIFEVEFKNGELLMQPRNKMLARFIGKDCMQTLVGNDTLNELFKDNNVKKDTIRNISIVLINKGTFEFYFEALNSAETLYGKYCVFTVNGSGSVWEMMYVTAACR